MTKIKDLIATLKTRNPEAQVFLMTTRKSPFENHLAGVVGREDMFDQKFRSEPGIAADDVFLVVGRRIRPGSLSAWIVSEHHDTIVHPVGEISRRVNTDELAGATLADIAREHVGVDPLGDAACESTEFPFASEPTCAVLWRPRTLRGQIARSRQRRRSRSTAGCYRYAAGERRVAAAAVCRACRQVVELGAPQQPSRYGAWRGQVDRCPGPRRLLGRQRVRERARTQRRLCRAWSLLRGNPPPSRPSIM